MSVRIDTIEKQVAQVASSYYTDLPYHNFDHVLSTLVYFDSLCEQLEERNVFISRPLGRIALFGHDAGFHEDHKAKGFDTKEQYSAHLWRVLLENLSTDKEDISKVESAIIATTSNVEPVTNLEKAVRYADVGNIYNRDYQEFVKNFVLLTKESLVTRRPVAETFEEQRNLSATFLQQYMSPIIFESEDGLAVELPPELNFAERNVRRLNQASIENVIKLFPPAKKIVPTQWLKAA